VWSEIGLTVVAVALMIAVIGISMLRRPRG
jgi:hypothetical protein